MRHQILGIRFFGGTSREAVEQITRTGGLPVAPGGIRLAYLVAKYRDRLPPLG